MYTTFTKTFTLSAPVTDCSHNLTGYPAELQEFLRRFGGMTFNQGLYRVFGDRARQDIGESVLAGFPEMAGKFIPVGADWLGRVVALKTEGAATILLFDPGTGRMSDSCLPLYQVHENLFADKSKNMLAELFFEDWTAAGHAVLNYSQCAGYKIPLFLGGSDEFENMEVSDLSVYWHLCATLIARHL